MRAMKCAYLTMQAFLGAPSTGLALSGTRLEQIANLFQEHLGSTRRRRHSWRGRLAADQPRGGLANPEDDERDDHEIDQRVDEQPDIDGRRAGFLRNVQGRIVLAVERDENVAEIDAADGKSDDRVDHILDQAADDPGEGRADDYADRQIDDIAAGDKGAKLGDPAGLFWQAETGLHPLPPMTCRERLPRMGGAYHRPLKSGRRRSAYALMPS